MSEAQFAEWVEALAADPERHEQLIDLLTRGASSLQGAWGGSGRSDARMDPECLRARRACRQQRSSIVLEVDTSTMVSRRSGPEYRALSQRGVDPFVMAAIRSRYPRQIRWIVSTSST